MNIHVFDEKGRPTAVTDASVKEMLKEHMSEGKAKKVIKKMHRCEEVNIHVNDNFTVANLRYKKKIRTGIAKRNPKDKYDSTIGYCIALYRAATE